MGRWAGGIIKVAGGEGWRVTLQGVRVTLVNLYKYLHWRKWTLKDAPYRNRGNRLEKQS